MKKSLNLFRALAEIVILIVIIAIFGFIINSFATNRPSSQSTSPTANQTASTAYPPPQMTPNLPSTIFPTANQTPSTAYPPPSVNPTSAATPTVKNTFSVNGPFPTPTFSNYTPYPTFTLRPGPSSTPIPPVLPGTDNAGKISYISKSNKDAASLLFGSVDVDATGKATGNPQQTAKADFIQEGYIFPSYDRNLLAIAGADRAFAIFDVKNNHYLPVSEKISGIPVSMFFNWFPDNRQILYADDFGDLILADPLRGDFTPLVIPQYDHVAGAAASPDGQSIIYSYMQGNLNKIGLYIITSNGQNSRLLIKTSGPAINITWSPNGKKIAYYDGALNIVNTDGSGLQSFPVTIPHCYFLPPVWSPDSQNIAFVAQITGESFCYGWGDANFQGTNIILINIEKGTAKPLFPEGETGNIDPAWSPDGSQIVFASKRGGTPEIWAVNVDGTNLRQLTQNDSMARFPIWSRP